MVSTVIAPNATPKVSSVAVFSTTGAWPGANPLSSGSPVTYCSTFHSESGSAGRVVFSRKNCFHDSG